MPSTAVMADTLSKSGSKCNEPSTSATPLLTARRPSPRANLTSIGGFPFSKVAAAMSWIAPVSRRHSTVRRK